MGTVLSVAYLSLILLPIVFVRKQCFSKLGMANWKLRGIIVSKNKRIVRFCGLYKFFLHNDDKRN
jgi:hypothetical protein